MEARDLVSDLLASGLTQVALAERTGMAQSTISKVLTGRVADVLSVNYRKLQALHCEMFPAGRPARQEPDRAAA